jgi:hypothetical protein
MAEPVQEPEKSIDEIREDLTKMRILVTQMNEKRALENVELALLDLKRFGSAQLIIDSISTVHDIMAAEYNQKYFPRSPAVVAGKKQKENIPVKNKNQEKKDQEKKELEKPSETTAIKQEEIPESEKTEQ